MTDKQREVYDAMNALVHKRMNEADLNERLAIIFDRTIEVEDLTDADPDWTGDWYFSFNVWNDDEESKEDKIGGFFDIYYLKMRENDDELDFYITEVTCDFCDI